MTKTEHMLSLVLKNQARHEAFLKWVVGICGAALCKEPTKAALELRTELEGIEELFAMIENGEDTTVN